MKKVLVSLLVLVINGYLSGAVVHLGDTGWGYEMPGQYEGLVSVALDSGGGEIILEFQKDFTSSIVNYNQGSAIWVRLVKMAENVADTIIIRDEIIYNKTGYHWYGFEVKLVGLAHIIAEDGQYVRFDGGQQFDSDKFAKVEFDDDFASIAMKDGKVADGEVMILDNGVKINIDVNKMAVGDYFSIKEFPLVPEPTGLLMIGLLGLWGLGRRK